MALSAAQLFTVAGRRVLVTGGGSGIGAMVAEGFAANGARVTIASRNEKALEETAARIRESTGGDIEIAVANRASREGCEALAKDFGDPLDVLVNNAALQACPKTYTKDGHEMHLQTNHLGHFLLTMLLQELPHPHDLLLVCLDACCHIVLHMLQLSLCYYRSCLPLSELGLQVLQSVGGELLEAFVEGGAPFSLGSR